MKRLFSHNLRLITAFAVLLAALAFYCPAALAVMVQQQWVRFSATAGETLATGDIVCIKDADGYAYKADANDAALRPAVGIIGLGAASGSKAEIIVIGLVSGYTGLSEGLPAYLSETAGGVTQSAPAYSQQIGAAVAATKYLFNFQNLQAKVQETVTAANVLTASECGSTFILSSATEFVTTLPAVSTVNGGCEFTFIVGAAPSGASYTIITGNSLENAITGGVVERETDTGDDGPYLADADTITIVDGVAVAGDYLEIISNGSTFYLHGQVNADGAVTITQAD